MTIGEFLRKYRKDHNLSQRALSRQVHISQTVISMLERESYIQNGKPSKLNFSTLNTLAEGMGMTADELLSQVENMPIHISSTPSMLSPTEQALLVRFRTMSPDERNMLLRSAGLPEESPSKMSGAG